MTVFRRTKFLALATAAMSALFLAPAAAEELSIPMDEVRMMTFRAPIRTVVVGNPVIADVSVVDDRHVFVLGKNIGATNVVVLNNEGQQIANEMISVVGRSSSVVTLQRGVGQLTYSCGGERCHQMPLTGDATEPYTTIAEQVDTRESAARAAAGAPAESQSAQNGPQQ